MAEHLLDGAEVGAAVEQVGRAGVAERVRMEIGPARAERAVAVDEELHRREAEAAAARRDEEGARIDGARAQVRERSAEREVGGERLGGLASERHDALLAPLADDAGGAVARGERELADVEPAGLGDAQPAAVEDLEDRAVAEHERVASSAREVGVAGRFATLPASGDSTSEAASSAERNVGSSRLTLGLASCSAGFTREWPLRFIQRPKARTLAIFRATELGLHVRASSPSQARRRKRSREALVEVGVGVDARRGRRAGSVSARVSTKERSASRSRPYADTVFGDARRSSARWTRNWDFRVRRSTRDGG